MKNRSSFGFPMQIGKHDSSFNSSIFTAFNGLNQITPQKQVSEIMRNSHQNIFSEKHHLLPVIRSAKSPNLRQEYRIGEKRESWFNHVEEKILPPVEVYDTLLDKIKTIPIEPFISKEKSFYADNYSEALKGGFNINSGGFRQDAVERERLLPLIDEYKSPKRIKRPPREPCSKKSWDYSCSAVSREKMDNESGIQNTSNNDISYIHSSNIQSRGSRKKKKSIFTSLQTSPSEKESVQDVQLRSFSYKNKRTSILKENMLMERSNFFTSREMMKQSIAQKLDRYLEKNEIEEEEARSKFLLHDPEYENQVQHNLNKLQISEALKEKELQMQQQLGTINSYSNLKKRLLGSEESFTKAKELSKLMEFRKIDSELGKFEKQLTTQKRVYAWMNHGFSPNAKDKKNTKFSIARPIDSHPQ